MRKLVEDWTGVFPAAARSDIVGRLRSSNRHSTAAFWELYLHETFAQSPNFFLSVECYDVGPREVSARVLRRELEVWLGSLDPDEGSLLPFGQQDRERYRWEADGWLLEFRPIPVQVEYRGRADHRPIGVVGPGEASVRFTMMTTAWTRYSAQVRSRFPSTTPKRLTLREPPDGYWLDRNGWRHTNVAGVLIAQAVTPWLVSKIEPTLWLHPVGESIDPLELWRTARVEGERIQ